MSMFAFRSLANRNCALKKFEVDQLCGVAIKFDIRPKALSWTTFRCWTYMDAVYGRDWAVIRRIDAAQTCKVFGKWSAATFSLNTRCDLWN